MHTLHATNLGKRYILSVVTSTCYVVSVADGNFPVADKEKKPTREITTASTTLTCMDQKATSYAPLCHVKCRE